MILYSEDEYRKIQREAIPMIKAYVDSYEKMFLISSREPMKIASIISKIIGIALIGRINYNNNLLYATNISSDIEKVKFFITEHSKQEVRNYIESLK